MRKDPEHVLEMIASILQSIWNHEGLVGIGFPVPCRRK